MLKRQKGTKDNWNYLKLERRYNLAQCAFTSVRSHIEWCPRVLFEQNSHLQNPNQDPCRFLSESRGDEQVQRGHYHISRQECPIQRIRKQVEMDDQIAHMEERVKEQYQSFQTLKQVDIDSINDSAQAPHR